MAAQVAFNINYDEEKTKCLQFLQGFKDSSDRSKYMELIQSIAQGQSRLALIDLTDIANSTLPELAHAVQHNALRYKAIFEDAVEALLPEPYRIASDRDVLFSQRLANGVAALRQENPNADAGDLANQAFNRIPPALRRFYEVGFKNAHKDKVLPVRAVRSSHMGHLVTVQGVVTRVTDVKPELVLATYTCDQCGFETYQSITSSTFKPQVQCPSAQCRNNRENSRLVLQTRGSRYDKLQQVRIQEVGTDVPVGHIPRAMTVHVKGELTRKVLPGDTLLVDGIYLPVAQRGALTSETFLMATHVTSLRNVKDQLAEENNGGRLQLTEEELRKINEMSEQSGLYTLLAKSIAPEIHGLVDIKKALLLLLTGGPRIERSGLRIRGDIHLCIMGDPGIAKSQLLKTVSVLATRGVYTTGKGSSGVGLTASVLRDPLTSELVLEGGSLVLADNGICCIDEFDKMDESDRTNIHEVMEQQTISIAKAGIQTTLNARTSILAAANPLYGRYNRYRTVAENVNLPAALLSRFDVLFLVLDEPDMDRDSALAQHVTRVHQNPQSVSGSADEDSGYLPRNLLRKYLAVSKQYDPTIRPAVGEYIANAYVELRRTEAMEEERAATYTTARTLLSLIRMALALARLRQSEEVEEFDVDEAMRLMEVSKAAVKDKGARGTRGAAIDPTSGIYGMFRDQVNRQMEELQDENEAKTVEVATLRQRVLSRGYNDEQLKACLAEYHKIGVWVLAQDSSSVRFV